MSYENPTFEESIAIVNRDFKMRYKKTLDDMHITETPGYWEANNPCNGECGMHPPSSLHHTFSFSRPGRGKDGKFLRPYRHWEAIRKGDLS